MSDQLAPNPVAVGRSQRPRVLGLVAAAVIPLLLLAAVSTWRGIAEAESRVADDRVAVARATALTADSLVAGQISALQNLAISGALADPIDGAALQGLVDRLLEANLNWDGLGLIGQDGWNIASALRGIETPIQPRTLNVADRPYFRQALTTGRPAVSPAVLGMVKNLPTVALAVPIDFESGGRGVFVVTLSLGKLEADLQTLAGRDGAGVILVDSSGQVFVHPNPAISRALTPLRG